MDEKLIILSEESTQEIAVSESEIVEIKLEEVAGYVAGEGGLHSTLPDINNPNQHVIEAITGLRDELDSLNTVKTPQTLYSDNVNVAAYYQWANEAYDLSGYFVSIVDGDKIQICNGTNIFGVVVDDAGFIGHQVDVKRDGSYGLVVTSGLVDVRCELDIEVGDCVVSNAYGYATKSTSDYGYRVVAKENKSGVEYAVIAMGVQADVSNAIGEELLGLDSRLDAAETNIISAINVAHQAYNKASEVEALSSIMSDKVNGALGSVDKVVTDVENMGGSVSAAAAISAQAKAIAESAATSAESMRNEAVTKANEALAETSDLRREFEALSNNMSDDLYVAVASLQESQKQLEQTTSDIQKNIDKSVKDFEDLEKDLEPLITWPEDSENPVGVAGFIAQADADSATLASIVTWKGDAGESLAGFVQEVTEENSTVKSIASYKRKDSNGNVIEPGGAAGLTAQVDANQAELNAVVSYEKDGAKGLSGLVAQVNENKSELSAVASYKKGEVEGLAGLVAQVDANKSELNTVSSYSKNGKTGLAGLSAYVDEHEASVDLLAKYSNNDSGGSGIAGLVSDVNNNTSTLNVVAEHSFTDDKGETYTGLAGIQAQVNDNTSEVSLVANRVAGKYIVIDSWDITGKDTSTVYYAKDTKLYWYYNGDWKSTADAYAAGLPASTAGIQIVADDHSSKINSLVEFESETNIAMARIEQKADANGAYIQSAVSNMDKYAVGPYSQAYGFTLEQAASVLEEGMVYVPTVNKVGNDAETYNYTDADGRIQTYTRTFLRGYLYQWGKRPNGLFGWITVDKNYSSDISEEDADPTSVINTSSMAVYFSTTEIAVGDSNNYGYWYTDGNTITNLPDSTVEYDPYTLYKWDLAYKYNDGEKDVEKYRWNAVATLAGNSQNRAVSQIRQDANSIELDVTNVKGDLAGIKLWAGEDFTAIQDTVSWKNDNDEAIATTIQRASNSEAYIAQVASVKNTDGTVNAAASIVAAVNNAGSSVVIKAEHLNLNGYVTISSLSSSGTTVIDGSRITTGLIKSSGYQYTAGTYSTSGTAISLDNGYIRSKNFAIDSSGNAYFNGTLGANAVSAITIDASQITAGELDAGKVTVKGDISAFGATIGGFTISGNRISKGISVDENNAITNTLHAGSIMLASSGATYSNGIAGSSETASWKLIIGPNFGVTQQGGLYASGVNIDGTITADEGSIGGFTISNKSLLSNVKIAATETIPGSFSYSIDGTIGASSMMLSSVGATYNGKIGGVNIGSTQWKLIVGPRFGVTKQGNLYASNANITGTITANDGYIGNVQITTTGLGVENEDGNSYITSTGIGAYKGMFNVGSIGGWTFGNYSLTGNYYILTGGTVSYLTNNASTQTLYYSQLLPDKLVTKEKLASVTAQQYIEWGTLTNITFDSDERLKNSIEKFSNEYDVFFDMLQPKRYKYNDGTSNRYHTGYIAQEVVKSLEESGLSTFDFAAVMLRYPGTEREKWQLRRDEFVALNTWQIQKLKARVTELENKIELLTSKNE